MYKILIFRLLSIIGRGGYPFYIVIRKARRYTRVVYSQLVKYSFAKPIPLVLFLGRHVNIVNPKNIVLGNKVSIDSYSTISTWITDRYSPLLKIGNCTEIGAFAHITAINNITIGNNVLIGRCVTITDNSHGDTSLTEIGTPPAKRKLHSKGACIIEDDVWIGDKCTILPGVKVGKGAIIGANSVVTKDIPPYVIACGNPAIIVKKLNYYE